MRKAAILAIIAVTAAAWAVPASAFRCHAILCGGQVL
jgi:hypothetical protein